VPARIAHACDMPTDRSVQSTSLPICTGASRCMSVPSPRLPLPFSPQHHSVPSLRMPQANDRPASIVRHAGAGAASAVSSLTPLRSKRHPSTAVTQSASAMRILDMIPPCG
jgi:hypothetical protein